MSLPYKRNVYVASSWRNTLQPTIVQRLREIGHNVYDYRNPTSTDTGFHWGEIDPNYSKWTPEEYVEALNTKIAIKGYTSDMNAMKWADTFVLLLPSGRSSHLEMGWAVGKGKTTIMLVEDPPIPELMVKMFDYILTTQTELLDLFQGEIK